MGKTPLYPSRPLRNSVIAPTGVTGTNVTGGPAEAPEQAGGWLNSVNQFVGSPTGQALIGGVGSALKQKSEEDLAREKLAQNTTMTREGLMASILQNQSQDKRARDMFAAQTRPIGESQNYLQDQAIKSAIFERVFGGQQQALTPGNPAIAAAMGNAGRAPQAADPLLRAIFDPSRVQQGAQSAIAQRDMDILAGNPYAGVTEMGALGLDDRYDEQRANYADDSAMSIDQDKQRQTAVLQSAIDANDKPTGPAPKGYEYDKKTGELKKKGMAGWKKALLIGGGIAATVATAGAASPALAAAIGAGTGALNGAASGGGWKGALTGAALGGATGGLGAGLGAGAGVAGGVKGALTNPNVWKSVATNTALQQAPNVLGSVLNRGQQASTPGILPGAVPQAQQPFPQRPTDAARYRK